MMGDGGAFNLGGNPHERLRSVGHAGHGMVFTMIRRCTIEGSDRTPEQIERWLMGRPFEELDRRGPVRELPNGTRVRDMIYAGPCDKKAAIDAAFVSCAEQACGRPIRMMEATRADLWRMCQYLEIELQRLNRPDLHPHYPDGWREVRATIRARMPATSTSDNADADADASTTAAASSPPPRSPSSATRPPVPRRDAGQRDENRLHTMSADAIGR